MLLVRKPTRYKLHENNHTIGSLGPGLHGDYFETTNEEILIQKLNTLRSSPEPLVIPPLLPSFKSDSSFDSAEAENDNPETFFHALAVEKHLQKQQQHQQHQQQNYHKPRLRHEEQKHNGEEGKENELLTPNVQISISSTKQQSPQQHNKKNDDHTRTVERIKATTSFWEYRKDDPKNMDPTGTITIEKVPLKSAPGRIRPRSAQNSSSSPLSVSTLTVSDVSSNNLDYIANNKKKQKSSDSPFTTSTTTTVKHVTKKPPFHTTDVIKNKIKSDNNDQQQKQQRVEEEEEEAKQEIPAHLPTQGREERKVLMKKLRKLLDDKGDVVAQQQKSQHPKPILKLRKSVVPPLKENQQDSSQEREVQVTKSTTTTKPPLIPTDSNLSSTSTSPLKQTTILQPEYQSIRIHRSSSFSSSIHEDDDENDHNLNTKGKKQNDYIEIKLPQHYSEFTSLKRSSSFSSSIHELDNDDNNNNGYSIKYVQKQSTTQTERPTSISLSSTSTPLNPLYHTLTTKQDMYTLLQNGDDLEDFKRINNFTLEGGYLLSKIFKERSRIQMKKEMLTSEIELYVEVHNMEVKRRKNEEKNTKDKSVDDVTGERKILFSC